jgi:dephospho-CoA kinase
MTTPFVLGLTGSIGMGKTTTAQMFRARGVPVYDADGAVHDLYQNEGVGALHPIFPHVIQSGIVHRGLLKAHLAEKPNDYAVLERIIHPLVRAREAAFREKNSDAALIVLDIPLLYETGADQRCDAVAVVSAPFKVQRARVMARGTMSEAEFDAIVARQLPDAEKRRRADFILDTSNGLAETEKAVDACLESIAVLRRSL